MAGEPPMHRVWTRIDIPLDADANHANPYCDVTVWVDLEGPGFSKRVYGFWDGGRSFVVRVLATAPGIWRWTSGSEPADRGLSGKTGSFEAIPWSEAELQENPNRRGMIRATADGRGLEYADGTPFFLLGDTWWSVPSFRFPLAERDEPKPLGPGATLNDYSHYRKAQGFNCIALIAAQPAWANDGHPPSIQLHDGTWVRAAWRQPGTDSAKDMHNEGGRPFEFPGKAPGYENVFPDVDRINPDYFKVVDRKIDYLNSIGFVPFVEAARRDTGQAWKRFYDWPLSFARYVQYLFARLQANIAILSPIHYDYFQQTITAREYNEACNLVVECWGKPPFGTLLSANPNPSTLVNFGGPGECKWLDLHQIGNVREHHTYWYLTEIHRSEPKKPALNGEPYYAGLHQLGTPYPLRVPPNSEADEFYVRSALYGSFLSGGFAGFIYGAEGIWQADVESESLHKMWDAFQWRSADQVRHLRTFAFVRGTRFRALEPDAELVVPNKTGETVSYCGWSYCAATTERDLFLLYFEKDAGEPAYVRGALHGASYQPSWFDPREGVWRAPGAPIAVQPSSLLHLPERPDDHDWGLMLELIPDRV
ncbi:MAG: DUF4038 domain-containing protein [Propylenella sp.]